MTISLGAISATTARARSRGFCARTQASVCNGARTSESDWLPPLLRNEATENMAWRSKLSQSLQELRIHLCQTSPASNITREYIRKNYKDLKSLNPRLPILIRECSGVQPRLWARYDYGVERSVALDGLTEEEINAKLEELVSAGPQCQ